MNNLKSASVKFFIIILLFISSKLFSQDFNKEKMDSLFTAIELNNQGMGSIVISKNGKTLYQRAIGYRYISEKTMLKADYGTKYPLCSITKTYTAVLVLQMVEEGKIKLETTLDKFYPSIPNAKKITINNLLNMRSGLYNLSNRPNQEIRFDQLKGKTKDQMLAIMSDLPPDGEPDRKFSYNNFNYFILGCIIEKISGKPFQDILQEKIFLKLDLKNTCYSFETNLDNNECYSYKSLISKGVVLHSNLGFYGAAGGIVSTPSDLATFMHSLFSGRLLNDSSLVKMKAMVDGYGMGLGEIPFQDKKGYGHNGGMGGFRTEAGYFPEDGLCLTYLSNYQLFDMRNILSGAISIYYNLPFVIPKFNKTK